MLKKRANREFYDLLAVTGVGLLVVCILALIGSLGTTVLPDMAMGAQSGTSTAWATVSEMYSCDVAGTAISFATVDNTAVYPNTSASTTVTITANGIIYLKVYDEGKGAAQPGIYGSTTTNANVIGSANDSFANTATLVANTEGYGIHAATSSAGSLNALLLSFRYGTSNQEGSVGVTYVGGLEVGSAASVSMASTTAGTTTGREVVVSYYVAATEDTDAGDYKDSVHYLCTPSP